MGWFDSESAETKMNKALEGFEIHTSDVTVKRNFSNTKFVQHVGLNTYDVMRELVEGCKKSGFNGIVGLGMTQSGGLGGAAGVVIYGTAVKFD
jgi:hypothetical protein